MLHGQSSRGYFDYLSKSIEVVGHLQSKLTHTMILRFSKEGKTTTLIVYIDDILWIGNDMFEIDHM